jgi:hypothetical protein
MAEPYVFPLVMPERSHAANETTFSADKQPKKRGRPRGSRNKMSPAMKAMIVEVIEELGRVDLEDWDRRWSQRPSQIPGRSRPKVFPQACWSASATTPPTRCPPQAGTTLDGSAMLHLTYLDHDVGLWP